MHEMSIAIELYRACRREVEDRGGGRLDRVAVAVGELAAVEPDLLTYAWEAVTAQGPDAGARLDVTWISATQTCPACGPIAERQSGTWLRLCPHCERPLEVEGGTELDVRTIEFDQETAMQEALT